MTALRIRGHRKTLRIPMVLVALAALGLGAWILRYAITHPLGLDHSALWAGVAFLVIGTATVGAWITLRRLDARDFVEVDRERSCYRVYWGSRLYAERPWSDAGDLQIVRLTEFRPGQRGSAWTWFEVSTSNLLFPLYESTSELDARGWAHELAGHANVSVQSALITRSASDDLEHKRRLALHHARAGTLEAYGGPAGVPGLQSWRGPRRARDLQRILDEARRA